MIAFILLKAMAVSLPDDVSSAIIGLFFGLICGLFYYQHYYKPYFWVFSLLGGLFFTMASHALFLRRFNVNETASIWLVIASFLVPFALTLALNQGLYRIKHNRRKRRMKLRRPTHFFEAIEPADSVQAAETGKDISG
jgi:hypothetical protein